MIGLTLFVGVVIANYSENKVGVLTRTEFALEGSSIMCCFAGHCTVDSGPEKMAGSVGEDKTGPTPPHSPTTW